MILDSGLLFWATLYIDLPRMNCISLRDQQHRNERKSGRGGHTSGARRVKILSCPSTFLALVVLVSAFVMVSTVWSVSCLLFFYSRCPRAKPFVKMGEGTCPPVPYGVGATVRDKLSDL